MKLELTLPTSLNEIPLCNYQKYIEAREQHSDDFHNQKLVEIFCGIDLPNIAKMKATDVAEIVAHFQKIFNEEPKFVHRFTLGGQEFGFIPNLENISLAEYVDLEKHLSDWKSYHKALAILYRPITETYKDKYEIAEYTASTEMQEVMKFAPLSIAISSSVFFWNLGKELLEIIPSFLEKKMSKEQKQTLAQELNLLSGGDGIQAYMHSLEEILQSSMLLPKKDYLSV